MSSDRRYLAPQRSLVRRRAVFDLGQSTSGNLRRDAIDLTLWLLVFAPAFFRSSDNHVLGDRAPLRTRIPQGRLD